MNFPKFSLFLLECFWLQSLNLCNKQLPSFFSDIPLPPKSRPNSEVLTQKSLLLSWDTSSASSSEGNSPGVSYIVEAKESSTPDWSLVAADVIDTSLLVRHLNPDGEYIFRVRAESDSGISEPSEETELIRPKEVSKYRNYIKK